MANIPRKQRDPSHPGISHTIDDDEQAGVQCWQAAAGAQ